MRRILSQKDVLGIGEGYVHKPNLDQRIMCRNCQHPKSQHKWMGYGGPGKAWCGGQTAGGEQCQCLEFMT
jgi:hypothetical protein